VPCPKDEPYNRAIYVEDLTPVYRDGQAEWELETLLKKRISGRSKEPEYLGRWKNCGPEWDQWLKLSDQDNAKGLIEDFEKYQPEVSSTTDGKTAKAARRKGKVQQRGKV
jgi:hypothetical protein